GDVAAHGRVRPLATSVAVETQVQLDEAGHGPDLVPVEAHGLHPAGGELGADHLVMVEAHPTPGVIEAPRRRLAYVVQQRGQTQDEVWSGHARVRAVGRALQGDGLLEHGQRVLVDVLVPV